jgi:ATP-dependent helicase Lhr and Lhr-like helicase
MGGAQFALSGAVERLRASGGGEAGGGRREARRTLVIAAADPAQPYGAALPWPKHDGQERSGRPARVAGAYVVLVEDEPALYVERGGRSLLTLGRADGARMGASPAAAPGAAQAEALMALADAVRAGHVGRLALERIDGQPAVASSGIAQTLVELGFQPGPRRFTLSA